MKTRLWFVDNLRIVLIALVVLHHTAAVYSGLDAWYYTETPTSDAAGLLLTLFLLVNQAWFMGAFFLVSGYFTPASYDRKGPRAFLRDRLTRLGIPLLFFYFVLNPILYRDWHGIGAGPLWFVIALLAFDGAYAAFRHATRNRPPTIKSRSPLSYRTVLAGIPVLALATWALRVVLPIGFWVPVIDFPTSAYLPQYAGFFAAGIVAYRRGWLLSTTARMGWTGVALAAGATLVFLPLALAGPLGLWTGGGTIASLCYALWDSTFAVGAALALVTLFRTRLNGQGRLRRYLTGNAFAVYVLHALVVTAVVLAVAGLHLPSLAKFALAAAVALPACFLLAGLVRRVPGVRRVL
jgi:glucan biosynthesis protein C